MLDLPDPFGIVRSRAMVDPTGSVRLSFNISEARETATNRFVSAYFGAGVHHIAFAAPNAGYSAGHWRAAQAPMLAVPANYYDDLAARLGLADGQTEALQRLGLLYDSDAMGEFRQAYTIPFHDRFFFEVVERHGAYAGFGAANAPVRMAAQARDRPFRDMTGRAR
jgi:4-hydroxyphenylpyruvate dioxygenase